MSANKNSNWQSQQRAAVAAATGELPSSTIRDRFEDASRPDWETYKKANQDKMLGTDEQEEAMVAYRNQLDREREQKLARGRNHRPDGADKKSKKKSSKKSKKSKKHKRRRKYDSEDDESSSYSSSKDYNSNSSDDDSISSEEEERRRRRRRRRKEDKKKRKKKRHRKDDTNNRKDESNDDEDSVSSSDDGRRRSAKKKHKKENTTDLDKRKDTDDAQDRAYRLSNFFWKFLGVDTT